MPKVIAAASATASRHQRGRRVGPTLAEINVIPLVDVMLVLLVIFMVAAPMLQRGVELNLPAASRSQEISSERLFVDVPLSFRDDRRLYIDADPVRLDVLAERIRQALLGRADRQVFLRIDRDLTVQAQIDVMNELRAAGVSSIGLVTEVPARR